MKEERGGQEICTPTEEKMLKYLPKKDVINSIELKVNEYTKEPVKTTYGYHIILKTGEKDKKALDDAKEEIKEKILATKKEDATAQITALDKIRKNYGLKFKDSKLKSIYKEYIDEQLENAKAE